MNLKKRAEHVRGCCNFNKIFKKNTRALIYYVIGIYKIES